MPDAARAMRGAAVARSSRDVLDPRWDFWSLAALPLDEVRALHGVAPLGRAKAPACA